MPTLCAYGHSWAFGTGATGHLGFAALTSQLLGASLDNRAVSGSLSTETAALVSAGSAPRADLFVLMTGLNDARLHGRSAVALGDYRSAVAVLLREFHQSSPDAAVLALAQPHLLDYSQHAPHNRASDAIVDDYNLALEDEVSRHPFARTVPIPGWDPRRMLAADTVHPNDLGHAHIARVLVQLIDTTAHLEKKDS